VPATQDADRRIARTAMSRALPWHARTRSQALTMERLWRIVRFGICFA